MDCGTSVAKYVLFIFNTLVSIISILGIVYGILILKSLGTIDNGAVRVTPETAIPIILITICSVVLLISFLGCCGAIRESVCMTMSYAVCLLVLLILQLTIVVLLFTHREKVNTAMGKVIDEAWQAPGSHENGVFDAIQKSFQCCGKNGAQDYIAILSTPPASCCAEGNCLNPLNIYGGCHNKFIDFMSGRTDVAKYVGLGLIAIELVGFIFACCLANNVRNYKRRNAY